MRIRYNAPVTLTFALAATLLLIIDSALGTHIILRYFTVPGRGQFNWGDILGYARLFTHAFGHASWAHLIGNFSFILLLGPILEEKYGSLPILLMMFATALITGFINVIFFTTGLLGASGIAFMMILLISFTNIKSGDIPLTFILVLLVYLVQQIVAAVGVNNISEMAHIIGGLCGSVFGFLLPEGRTKPQPQLPA